MMGVCKSYTLRPDYVLYDMSYANVTMYLNVLPSYDDKEEKDNIIDADDPANQELIDRQFNE